MCGIAGIISKSKIDTDLLKKMTDVIAHRGPDGEGHWLNDAETVGFGHRRLSIIDLSDAGKQPMHYNERYTITYNGEIYNYVELKSDLIKDGYTFTNSTDTEVLLALYAKYGKKCLEYIDGMFAFAIYDTIEKTIFCARDRFGEKPFYYAYKPNSYFIFGSEIKQLFKAGVSTAFNNRQLFNYLENPYALTNPSNAHETFYEDINKLPKASFIIVDAAITIKEELYWKIDLEKKAVITYEAAVEKFRELFFKSIQQRMRSDVPVGSSLSGGLDSSSIVCAIQKLYKERGITQKTFSARFENFSRDEGKFIDYVLNQNKVTPYHIWPNEEGFMANFQDLLYYQDEPFPSASIYAQYSVMQEAKKQNVVVLLDGQGADELLAGYEYYLPFYLKELAATSPTLFQSEMESMKAIHPHLQFDKTFEYKQTLQNPTPIGATTLLQNLKAIVRPLYRILYPKKYERIKHNLPLANYYNPSFFEKIKDEKKYDFSCRKPSLNEYLKHSIQTNNLEDLLRFSDRNAMAHSREVRLPFLSKDLVEFLFALPASYKIKAGWTKALLRDAMHGILPTEIERRIDKIGYEPPQKKWMQHPTMEAQIVSAYQTLIKHNILNALSLKAREWDWQVLNIATLIRKTL